MRVLLSILAVINFIVFWKVLLGFGVGSMTATSRVWFATVVVGAGIAYVRGRGSDEHSATVRLHLVAVFTAPLAILLLLVFHASVTNLIPLYTIGVFIAFTLSQAGMVRHWLRLRDRAGGWRRKLLINGLGAVTTGVVAIEVAASKLLLGAWIVLLGP